MCILSFRRRNETEALIKQMLTNRVITAILRAVQVERSGNLPFVTAIVFLLNWLDFACNGLYDCFTIIIRFAGELAVAPARCCSFG